jgi:hypothetical protein
MNNFLSGFEIIRSKSKERSKFEQVVISSKYVSFSAALRKRTAKKYVGFYMNTKTNEIIIHISPIKQSGYFGGSVYQYKSKNILDMFKGLGYGIDVVDVLTRLTFLDENTILIKRKGDK